MARLTDENVALAQEIIGRYPITKSALIPLCHLAQEQDGHLAPDAMEHIAELLDLTAAEVLGVASFYEMFKLHPVGQYVINVCTSISCFLLGGDELLEHAEEVLGIKAGGTTEDAMFSLDTYECIAACTEAPCLQVNYRYFTELSHADFDALVEDLRAGRRTQEVPPHGVLARVRQRLDPDRRAGVAPPTGGEEPVWIAAGRPALPERHEGTPTGNGQRPEGGATPR